jgi:hypothetical protein
MLLLALVAMAPGASIVPGLLLMIPAFQMIAGQPAPVFPRRIAAVPSDAARRRTVATSRASAEISREVIHPRWPTPLEATKRLRNCRRDTEHCRGVHSDPPEQRHPRPW